MTLRIQLGRTAIQARLGGSAGLMTFYIHEPVVTVALADSRPAAQAVILICPDAALD
ncbi:MAG TPA: hypothetical protein VEH50_05090 [Methylomirabilota bacterium]|jgi:hypothetical protein|nr:hypothetical protein [Methylomirabilota bacterium]